jgi:flagellar basal-body rod modification protein FlgD
MSIPSTEAVGTPYFGASGAAATTGTTAGTSSSSSTAVDKDMFLKLMVEQLKNQDPMNPTDSSAFLAQTAQFTSLEKLEAVATQSAQSLTAQMAFGASGLVGRSITYLGADGAQGSGKVDSVRFTATGPLLGVNGAEIELASVQKVAG